jgi:hypothetical protein
MFHFVRAAIGLGAAIFQSQIGQFSSAGSSGKHGHQLLHKLDNCRKAS